MGVGQWIGVAALVFQSNLATSEETFACGPSPILLYRCVWSRGKRTRVRLILQVAAGIRCHPVSSSITPTINNCSTPPFLCLESLTKSILRRSTTKKKLRETPRDKAFFKERTQTQFLSTCSIRYFSREINTSWSVCEFWGRLFSCLCFGLMIWRRWELKQRWLFNRAFLYWITFNTDHAVAVLVLVVVIFKRHHLPVVNPFVPPSSSPPT